MAQAVDLNAEPQELSEEEIAMVNEGGPVTGPKDDGEDSRPKQEDDNG